MGDFQIFERTMRGLGVKKKGRPVVMNSNMFYPSKEERELRTLLHNELTRSWTYAMEVALRGISDTVSEMNSMGFDLPDEFKEAVGKSAQRIVTKAQLSLSNFAEMTIGAPYYPPALEGSVKKDWEDTFQQLCISAESDAKAKIARIVNEGKAQGMNKLQLEALVKKELPVATKHRAELISRTETGKLNNAATMATYKSAGIKYYRWLAGIDDRTRPTHAALNGLICAVGNPDVYYEETPDGLVEHDRGPDRYHGYPGTDFQCRCSCVPWDPRIDGKYEFKESPEPEDKEPSKLEQAMAETQAEKEAREKAEKQAKEMQRKVEILQKANERHAARTAEQRAEIQARWNTRIAERAAAVIEANDIVGKYGGITEFPVDNIKNLLANNQTMKALVEAQKLKSDVESEISKLGLLDEPLEVLKQWGAKNAEGIQQAVENKLSSWSSLDLQNKKKKLEFEIGWLEKTKKYNTWEISQKAYKKQLDDVLFNIAKDDELQKFNILKAFAQGVNDKTLKSYISAAEKLSGPTNNTELQEFKKAVDKAEKRSLKVGTTYSGTYDKKRLDAAVWDKGDGSKADAVLRPGAEKNWQSASDSTKDKLYGYTISYCHINEPLENRAYTSGSNKGMTRKQWESYINEISDYISKERLPQDMWFQRGDDSYLAFQNRFFFAGNTGAFDPNPKTWVGKTFQEGGFMSTGSAKGKGLDKHIIMNVFAPKGTQAAYCEPFSFYGNGGKRSWNGKNGQSSYSQEFETLFQRGTKFKVTKVEEKNGRVYLDCEIIDQELKDLSYVSKSAINCK